MSEHNIHECKSGAPEGPLRQVLDAMPVPVALVCGDGRIVYRSEDLSDLFGYTADDISTESDWWRLAYPDEEYRERARRDWYEEMERAIRENRKPRPREWVVTCKDGSTKHIEFNSAIVGEDYLVMLKDVTERKQLEESSRVANERLRYAMEGANDGLWDVDMKTNIAYLSPRDCEILGYSPDEASDLGLIWSKLIHPDDLPTTYERLNAYFEGRTPMFEVEQRLRTKSGDWKWVLARGKLVERDSDNNPLRIVGTHTDITERRSAEEALRLTQYAVENMQDSAFWITSDAGFIYVNSTACEELGYSREELLQMTVHDIDPTFPKSVWTQSWEDLRARKKQKFETVHQAKDGHLIPVEITARLLEYGGEEYDCAFARDITERRRAEEALRESEERLRLATSAAHQGIYDLDLRTGEAKTSPEHAAMLGYDPADFHETYRKWLDRLHPDDQARVDDIFQAYVRGEIPEYEVESRQMTQAGEWKWIFSTGKIIEWDSEGKPIRMVGINTDVTERKHVEEDLALTNEELRVVNRLISETTGAADLQSILDMAVDEALGIVGLEGGTLCLLRPDNVFQLAAHRATTDETLADIESGSVRVGDCLCGMSAKTGKPFILPTQDAVHDFATRESLRGEKITFHAAFPLVVESRCVGVLCVFTRMGITPTERSLKLLETATKQIATAVERATLFEEVKRNAEELEQRVIDRTIQLESANRELEAFSYSVSHDLRSPLRAINGFSSVIQEDYSDKLDDEGKEYLNRIRLAAVKMGNLIDDILRLSRIARTGLVRGPINLSEMVESVASELITDEPGRKVEFVVEPGLVADADANLMKIALENMVGNAWKFTGKRECARIEFGAVRDDGKITYYVKDNGAGFDQTYADKLFGAFQRLHSDTEFPGTGVGMATVKRIISRHGGDVWAEGEVDKGAIFYFTLEGGR